MGAFARNPAMRNILGQSKNTFDLSYIMDNRKILIVNLSKGVLGEDMTNLLGSLLVCAIQQEAMKRASVPEEEREDFHLYIDEFQNFTTDAFDSIVSEARKIPTFPNYRPSIFRPAYQANPQSHIGQCWKPCYVHARRR